MALAPLLLVALSLQEPAAEQEHEDAGELLRHEVSETSFELASWLSDDFAAARESWARRGFELEAYLTTDASALLSGGADPGSTALRGLFDAIVSIDGGRVLGIPDSRLVLGLEAFGGDDGSAEAGVVQAYSNIDAADDRVQIARVWYEQAWNGGATRVRAGKMDANALFAEVAASAHFIHSSMALSPTILGMPTYPDTAFGIAAGQSVGEAFRLRLGVYDGAANAGVKTGSASPSSVFSEGDELFFVGQASTDWSDGQLTVGGWRHTGTFARFDGGEEEGAGGLFLVLDQRWAADARGRTLDSFLQLGQASEDVSPMTLHVGLGAVASNLLQRGRGDVLGLGVSSVQLSDAPGAPYTTSAETALELFFGFEVVPGLRIKPDLQVIVDPGGNASLDDAWIATLRMTLSL